MGWFIWCNTRMYQFFFFFSNFVYGEVKEISSGGTSKKKKRNDAPLLSHASFSTRKPILKKNEDACAAIEVHPFFS